MRSRRAGVARPPHRVTHSNASVRRSIGPACVHRLRNRPPGVARGHIRIPEECSSTDCVTEHNGRWSWPPRSWLVGFCLLFICAGCVPSFRYVCDRACSSAKHCNPAHCHCTPIVDAALRRWVARSAPEACRQRGLAIALPTSLHSTRTS